MMLSEEELVMLKGLADKRGLTASDLFRTLLREGVTKWARENGTTSEDLVETIRHRMHPPTSRELEDNPITGEPPRRVHVRGRR